MFNLKNSVILFIVLIVLLNAVARNGGMMGCAHSVVYGTQTSSQSSGSDDFRKEIPTPPTKNGGEVEESVLVPEIKVLKLTFDKPVYISNPSGKKFDLNHVVDKVKLIDGCGNPIDVTKGEYWNISSGCWKNVQILRFSETSNETVEVWTYK